MYFLFSRTIIVRGKAISPIGKSKRKESVRLSSLVKLIHSWREWYQDDLLQRSWSTDWMVDCVSMRVLWSACLLRMQKYLIPFISLILSVLVHLFLSIFFLFTFPSTFCLLSFLVQDGDKEESWEWPWCFPHCLLTQLSKPVIFFLYPFSFCPSTLSSPYLHN